MAGSAGFTTRVLRSRTAAEQQERKPKAEDERHYSYQTVKFDDIESDHQLALMEERMSNSAVRTNSRQFIISDLLTNTLAEAQTVSTWEYSPVN
jgi:hypothetical protein